MTRERPILFSGPMVRAILDGRKTQTRRIVQERSPHWVVGERRDGSTWLMVARDSWRGASLRDDRWLPAVSPYGAPGDRLWVRETWAVHWMYNDVPPNEARCHNPDLRDGDNRWFAADHADAPGTGGMRREGGIGKWRPSIHMPRWASRITLEVTEVRVERLQDITEEDAKAEGVDTRFVGEHDEDPREVGYTASVDGYALQNFRDLWDKINGKRAALASNPWVWVVSFRRMK